MMAASNAVTLTRRRQWIALSVVESEVANAAHRRENPRRLGGYGGDDQGYEFQSSTSHRIIMEGCDDLAQIFSGKDQLREKSHRRARKQAAV